MIKQQCTFREEERVATLRERLRELRLGKGWTQQELQEISNVPYTTISRIETGATEGITSPTLSRLADAFGVTVDYLMGRSDSPTCLGDTS
jgi:transcriptional regulator with XRE-family HTH domain